MSVSTGQYESYIRSSASEWVEGITTLANQLANGVMTESARWAAIGIFYYNKFDSFAQQAQSYANAASASGDANAAAFWNTQANKVQALASGKVRDLWEAASQSLDLRASLAETQPILPLGGVKCSKSESNKDGRSFKSSMLLGACSCS